jgi:RHS repeat-associated protein
VANDRHSDTSGNAATTPSLDDQSSQIAPPTISLPKGGGAIKGIGEKFSANPANGVGTFNVPVAISAARSGFQPDLALVYNSGAGNGLFGFGWQLTLASITRKTAKGLPQYQDASDSDVFILSSAEDLTPVMTPAEDGTWSSDEFQRGEYHVKRYRPRVEGLFARIERWVHLSDGDTHWRSISKDNVLNVYGWDISSRVTDPDDASHVFSWLICQSYDDKGNAIVFEYVAEDDANVDRSAANEQHRARGANRYIKRIRYGNRQPLLIDPAAPSYRQLHAPPPDFSKANWMFDVVFDYGEGLYQQQPPDADGRIYAAASMTPSPGSAWPTRQDPFSSYRATFEVRNYRLCRGILTFHHFPTELGASDYLVRATELKYDEKPTGSFVTQIVQSGFKRRDNGRYLKRSLPPLELAYTKSPLEDPAYDDYRVDEVDAASLENMPTGLEDRYRWVDLDGEGISGVLTEQAGGWFYKPNLGDGSFGPVQCVAEKPSLANISAGHQVLLDVGGDGNLDLVELAPPTPGFYERIGEAGWLRFRAFASFPNVEWADPNLRLFDITGDGIADVLITEDECISWHPSLGEEGFGAAVRVQLPHDEELGPWIVFADPQRSIFVADLTGDGLNDIVRIRNGEVCYWPNRGFGRFGPKVAMDIAPWFDAPDLFDPRRIRLADTDGSGTTDILYLGRDGVRVYLNQAGNSWSEARLLRQFPTMNDATSVSVVDLLGRGTACIVWSSPLPGNARCPMHYVDLMDGLKPHLLVKVRNNLGAETIVDYASSTEFYLADKAAGNPWVTRLPFPVHVVKRLDTYDRVGRNRFVTRYDYHHGYFDGIEREFRGFGRVERTDTEELAVLHANSAFPSGDNIDAASYVPPVLTKSWFHTGAYFATGRVLRQFEHEYYREGDATLGESELTDAQLKAMRLDDTLLPDGLAADESREACRAIKGSLLRREVFSLDRGEASDRPYSVSESNYTIRPLQPRAGNRYGVFLAHPREAIELNYERKLYTVSGGSRTDPRVTHALTLEVDDYGDVLLAANVTYARRFDDADPLLTAADRQEQKKLRATFTTNAVTNPVLQENAWRTPQPAEMRTFDLLNVAASSVEPSITNLFRFEELHALILASGDGMHELPYEDVSGSGISGAAPFRRRIEHTRTLYRKNDLTLPLALGAVESLALPFDQLKLAFTAGLAQQLFVDSGKIGAAALATALADEGGYVHGGGDADWWIPSQHLFYSPNASDTPAQELAQAIQHFFIVRRYRDPFGNSTTVTYDAHDLLVLEKSDPLDNRVTAGERDSANRLLKSGNDYRVLQPAVVMDANRNRSAAAFDAFGLLVGTARMGKPEESAGDSLDGFDPDLSDAAIAAYLAAPLADPRSILQRATARLVYDIFAFARTQVLPEPHPAVLSTLVRETHDADPGGHTTKVQCRFGYSDGFGREIQKKAQAAGGPLVTGGPDGDPRWIGSGWTIYNNKGNVVRKYEPFFDDTHAFKFGNSVGVSAIVFYDPIDRVVANVRPNHSWEKAVWDPWRQETWDLHDTVLIADPKADADVGDLFRRLPDEDYLPTWYAMRSGGGLGQEEQDAAAKTAIHAATPTITFSDSLGRNFVTIAHNKLKYSNTPPADPPTEDFYRTRFVFDSEGNQREVIDALERTVVRYDYDMLGHRLRVVSMEAGERLELSDVAGKQLRRWDGRGHVFAVTYDALRRPLTRMVRGTDAVRSDPRTLVGDLLFEKIDYGEGQPNDVLLNLRTRAFRNYDGAGIDTSEQYDFKGNLLRSSRRFTRDCKRVPDWAAAQAMDEETFTNRGAFDALNRPLTLTTPDGSIASPSYDEASLLTALDVQLRGSPTGTQFVGRIEYNAKGQRTRVEYGNGAITIHEYDPLTFRLTRTTTTRPAGANGIAAQIFSDPTRIQDLRYTLDPTGNVTRLADEALQRVFYNNEQVAPVSAFAYDAIYRLLDASGREHIAQSGFILAAPDGNDRDYPFAGATQLADLQAIRNYGERYTYDAVGNLIRTRHQAKNRSWTRDYAYAEASVVEPAKVSNRLSRTTLHPDSMLPIVEPYGHDGHGSMTAMPHLLRLEWDFKGQLSATARQVVSAGVPETTYYIYAAGGQRLRKVNERPDGARKSERLYLRGSEHYREYAADGVTVSLARETLHVSEAERHLAIVETKTIDVGVAIGSPAPAIRYQLGNQLDSSMIELDSAAALISYEEYAPYGITTYQAGRSAAEVSLKRYRYAGKERDEENGFNRHGVRYYAPWLARWTSCDPAGLADDTNLYRYSRSNPLRMSDPNGTQSDDPQRVPSPVPEESLGAHADNAPQEATGDGAPSSNSDERATVKRVADAGDGAPSSNSNERGTGDRVADAGEQLRSTTQPAQQLAGDASAPSGANGVEGAPASQPSTTPPAQQPADSSPKQVTSQSPNADRTPAAQQPAPPAPEPNWINRITKFTDSHELSLASKIKFGIFVLIALTLIVFTARVNRHDPGWLHVAQIFITAGAVAFAIFLAFKDLGNPNAQGVDNRALDRWSIVHTLAGVVMGLFRVPFPIVAALTVSWEVFETTVPGFGESEINANRIMDITVAWGGWLIAAGTISAIRGQQMPWGFNKRSYTEDRLLGVVTQ